jgi:hypothetical protein
METRKSYEILNDLCSPDQILARALIDGIVRRRLNLFQRRGRNRSSPLYMCTAAGVYKTPKGVWLCARRVASIFGGVRCGRAMQVEPPRAGRLTNPPPPPYLLLLSSPAAVPALLCHRAPQLLSRSYIYSQLRQAAPAHQLLGTS